eukprot:402184-Prymnesium_polylepis.1
MDAAAGRRDDAAGRGGSSACEAAALLCSPEDGCPGTSLAGPLHPEDLGGPNRWLRRGAEADDGEASKRH